MSSVRKRFLCGLSVVCLYATAQAKAEKRPPSPLAQNLLEQLSASLQSIAKQVEPAVVQIFNSAYAIEADNDSRLGTVVAQQRSSGSGILVTSDGFIVTNSHVVQGARHLWVRLNKDVPNVPSHLQDATLVGMDPQTDLAVVKINLCGLPSLKFADSSQLNQGRLFSLLATRLAWKIPSAWEWSARLTASSTQTVPSSTYKLTPRSTRETAEVR
jgi:S1-C subfamily serine protease